MIIGVLKHAMMITSFVLIMMLLIEYINVQTRGSWQQALRKSRSGQVLLGAVPGATPGCLDAFTVVSLYSHRSLSFGALVAAMIATSGDESFVLFSMVPAQAVRLTAILFLVALVAGWLTSKLFKQQDRFLEREDHELELHEEEICHCFAPSGIAQQLKEISRCSVGAAHTKNAAPDRDLDAPTTKGRNPMIGKKGHRVSLVLGSGGARGLAHIGIIRRLEEMGYSIESLAGASMGALVGGIYAAGHLDNYSDWVCALRRTDVLRFLDLSFRAGGLFKGDRIMDTLKGMVGDHAIEDLPLAYTAVATDIDRQREVWISEGPLFDAIRASIAVPTIFTPHEYMGFDAAGRRSAQSSTHRAHIPGLHGPHDRGKPQRRARTGI